VSPGPCWRPVERCATPMEPRAVVQGTAMGSPRNGPTNLVVTTPIGSPPTLAVTDACTMNPALRIWIEYLVDVRVEEACRQIKHGELANWVGHARREVAVARSEGMEASAVVAQQSEYARQQSEYARQHLEGQVRGLADAQARMLAVVESLSGDVERQYGECHKVRSEALAAVDRVMATVDELQRAVEEDAGGASARLRQMEVAIQELRKAQAEDSSRHRASVTDLQRLLGEASLRQRQCSDELASACSSVAGTRQQVADLERLVHRVEAKLEPWRNEIAAEVFEALRSSDAAHESAREADRQAFNEAHEAHRRDAAAARSEHEARLEALRSDLDARQVESHQALQRRLDALQASSSQDMETARRSLDELAQVAQGLDQGLTECRSEASRDLEVLRSEVTAASRGVAQAEERLEGFQVELSTVTASKESFECRFTDWQEKLRNLMESLQSSCREELAVLQRKVTVELRAEARTLLKSEQNAIAALDEQLWLTDQRLGQRIDEMVQLVQALGLGERSRDLPGRCPTPPRGMRNSASRGVLSIVRAEREASAERCDGGHTSKPECQRQQAAAPLSQVEHLERLRQERRRFGNVSTWDGAVSEQDASSELGPGFVATVGVSVCERGLISPNGGRREALAGLEAEENFALGTLRWDQASLTGIHSVSRREVRSTSPLSTPSAQ